MLADTVASILRGNRLPTELVIIDQSDTRNTTLELMPAVPGCEMRYLWTHLVGLGRARNAGIAAARYEILAFIDDDMWVPADWYEKLISAISASSDRNIVTGQVLAAEPEITGGFAPSLTADTKPAVYEGRGCWDILFTGNMAISREVVEQVGLFDDELGAGAKFPSAEDNDYCFRLLEAGYRIYYVPGAIVYHRSWRPKRDYLPLRWRYGLGQGAFYAKYVSFRDRYMLGRMCKDLVTRIALFPWRIFRDRQRASGDIAFVAGLLTGAIRWAATRRRA
jgi:GT2 family glycosyltransferase